MIKYIIAWFPMIVIAIGNGALRELVYGKFTTELRAHQIATVLGCVLFGFYMYGVIWFWNPGSGSAALSIGLVWVALTICFEFIFGHYVAGHSWGRLLQDYNIFAGRVWIIALIWLAFAPYIFFRLR